jgi:CheY-like chemotaxis protein
MGSKRILSVGQCAADHSRISQTIQERFKAEVLGADDLDEAVTRLRKEAFDLVLVNRVLDADGSSGLDVIKQIKSDGSLQRLPVMLVSNHDDAQHQAERLGAMPGFGKAALGQPAMVGRMQAVLGQ